LTDAMSNENLVPGGTIHFPDIQNPIVDFLAASLPNGAAGAYRNETPMVQECQIHWCVKTIQAQFEFGNYTEVVTEEMTLNTNDAEEPFVFPGPGHLDYLPQFNLTLPDHQSANGSTIFGLNNLTARMNVESLWTFVPAVWAASSATAEAQVKFSWRADEPMVFMGSDNVWTQTSNKSDLMESLATSMTNLARITPNSDTNQLSNVSGTSWRQETHVHTRWEWVTLPFGLLLFSLVFLLSVVWQSSKDDSNIGIWKTSALAVLFNGLGEDIQETIGPKVKIGDARSRAKKLTVRLED